MTTEEETKAIAAENKKLKADNEKLTAEVNANKHELEALQADKAALQKANADLSQTNATLQKTNDALVATNEQLTTDLEQADTVIVDLKEELAGKAPAAVSLPTVEIDGETYELTSSFTWGGVEITIEVLQDNAKLAAELVEAGVGNLRVAE